jgi:subtilisin family serine protease
MKRSLSLPALGLVLLLSACGSEDTPDQSAIANQECSIPGAKVADDAIVNTQAAPDLPQKRFIVKFAASPAVSSLAAQIRRTQKMSTMLAAGTQMEDLGEGFSLLKLTENTTKAELEAKLPAGEIEYVEPDTKVYATAISDDPYVGKQWAHAMVDTAGAWKVSRGRDVLVAVLDTGIDYTHPDLAPNMWKNPGEVAGNGVDDDGDGFVDDVYGWNFVSDNNKPMADDDHYHGTHVAGTIGAVADNGIGVAGHAPNVKLMALKFLGKDGSGYTSDAVKGVLYAVAHHAQVINNSWGGASRSQALSDAIDKARAAGIFFVVAAGNEGVNNDKVNSYPTNYPQDNLVRVAASDSSDKLASFSNYGAKTVDLAAPGVTIYSTKNGATYQNLSGTSMATPLISGVIATMISARPDLDYQQIKGTLLSNVDVKAAYRGKVAWNGRVNAGKALRALASLPAGWTPPEPPANTGCN